MGRRYLEDYISAVRPLCRVAANAKETDLQTIIFMNRNTLCIRFFYMNCTVSVNTTTIAAEIPKMGGGIAMKATGIVRRIDDLGRVVIPKEIRRTLRIREGDPLEIYTDRDGEVIFKKYSPMGEMGAVSAELAEAMARTAGMSCAICDRDAVIAAAGGAKKDILERSISSELEQLMERRECYERGVDEQPEVLISSQDGCAVVAAAPIITDGDVSGCVAFVSEKEDEKADEVLLKLCQSAAQFLSKRIAV